MHFEQKKSDFSRKIETELSKHFFLSRKTVKKNLFAGKDYIFLQFFRPLSARKEWLLPWIVGMSAGNEISQSAGKNWPKSQFFEKKLSFSSSMRTFKMKHSFFGFPTSAGLSKLQVTCLFKLVFRRCSSFSKFHNLFSTFSFLIEAIRSFRNYCWKFFKTFFLRVHFNHSWRFCINEKRLTFFWRLWNLRYKTLDICDFSEKIRARSSKLFSASPLEDFGDKLVFWNFIVFTSFPNKFEQVSL